MINFDKNKLIGIPYKFNHKDFKGCDCRGIIYLYYKYVLEKTFPFSDGKRVFLRNQKKDIERITNALDKIGDRIPFEELKENNVVILKIKGSIGSMGVCINNKQLLHMDKYIGSCLTKIEYLKDLFLYGYKLNEKLL